jgi:hypothetical protein
MINIKTAFTLFAAISLALTSAASAGDAKSYRAVGNIQRVSDTLLLLRTSSQDLELTRDAKTKINGQLTRGALATVIYTKIAGRPYATEVTVGPAKK